MGCRPPVITTKITQQRRQIRQPTVHKEPEKKSRIKEKSIFKTMIHLASKFTGKTTQELNSIRLTKIPLPDKRNGKLRIQATNLETWFTGTIKHKDTNNKSPLAQVCVNAVEAKEASANINGAANIEIAKNGINVNGQRVPVSCHIKRFPSVPEPIQGTRKKVYNITDLGTKLKFLAPALDKHLRDRAVIYFDLKNGRLVATDGHRMHIAPTGKDGHDPRYAGKDILVVPDKILKVNKVLSGQFAIQKKSPRRNIVFKLNMRDCIAEVGSVLHEGQFPDYQRIIPEADSFCGKYTTVKEEVLWALKGAAKAMTKDSPGAQFEFSTRGVWIQSPPHEPTFRTIVNGGRYEGEVYITGLNVRFLLDVIRNIPDDRIEILLPKSRNNAWLVKGPQSQYMAMIMPINL